MNASTVAYYEQVTFYKLPEKHGHVYLETLYSPELGKVFKVENVKEELSCRGGEGRREGRREEREEREVEWVEREGGKEEG